MSDDNAYEVDDLEENPIDREPGLTVLPENYVQLYDSPDYETSEIICATLASQGIHAVMNNPSFAPGSNVLTPLAGNWSHVIFVAPDDLDTARALLATPAPTEDELAAEQAADPTTLEEAENNVRNA